MLGGFDQKHYFPKGNVKKLQLCINCTALEDAPDVILFRIKCL